jgi:hypothetical protein
MMRMKMRTWQSLRLAAAPGAATGVEGAGDAVGLHHRPRQRPRHLEAQQLPAEGQPPAGEGGCGDLHGALEIPATAMTLQQQHLCLT